MTLISAFRCLDWQGKGAFVVCADAQETMGDYRFFLEKLEPQKTGNYELLIGGSGYADLIEAFQLRLYDVLPSSSARSIAELKNIIQAELLDFIKVEVQAFIGSKGIGKMIRLVIAAHAQETNECECWITKASRLKPIREFDLIGIDDPIYRHIARRLYAPDMGIGRAIRACLYLFSIAKATSTGIGGPTSLAVLRMNGLYEEEKEFIEQFEEHLTELTAAVDVLAIALSDSGISAIEFESILQGFTDAARSIREKHVLLIGGRIVEGILTGKDVKTPYPKFPEGSLISVLNVDPKVGEVSISIKDKPHFGFHVGHFEEGTFSQEHSASHVRLCGKRRVVGNRVFVEVVPCKLGVRNVPHPGNGSCISDTWLETITATNSDDAPPGTP